MLEQKLDRRVRYTRGVIKESFITLLGQKPLSRITVKEICQAADINRATFYAHYADQFDLLEKIEQELMNELALYLGLEDENVQITRTTVDTLIRILDYIRENAGLISVLFNTNGEHNFRELIIRTLQDFLIAEWSELQGMSQEEAEYSFTFVLIGAVGVIQKWLDDGMTKSSRELAELIMRLAMGPRPEDSL